MAKTSKQRYKQVAVSPENYSLLKGLGTAGDTMNDALDIVLKRAKVKE